jgi:hypothetical protein
VDGDGDIDCPILERHVREVGLDELGLGHLRTRDLEHAGGGIQADDAPAGTQGKPGPGARPGADVEDSLARLQISPAHDLGGDRRQRRHHRDDVVGGGARERARAPEARPRHARWRPTKRSIRSIASTICS